ncbi:hypothetical protein ACPV5U_19275 [Vibrio mediterranei]
MFTTNLVFGYSEKQIISSVLERLDSEVFGNEFQVNKLGDILQVTAIKSQQTWHFQSKDWFLGHMNAIHQFTSGTLSHLK